MDEEFNAGEVELLLDDASAVEEKIVKVLIKLFGGSGSGDTKGARRWLFGSLMNDPEVRGQIQYIIRHEIDRELNRRKDEYK